MPNKPGGKINPNSLENLKLGRRKGHGRTQDYEEPKRKRGISVTDRGWSGLETFAGEVDISVSELLERVGRGIFSIIDAEALKALEDQLDKKEKT